MTFTRGHFVMKPLSLRGFSVAHRDMPHSVIKSGYLLYQIQEIEAPGIWEPSCGILIMTFRHINGYQ